MTLTPQFLDELRARTSLSALIGKSTKLQKSGREMRGCCPFHNEKTPSFYVNDDKGFYHCFGCSAHGDAIRWLTDQRGLPFMDAVKELTAAAGLDMPVMDRQSAQRAERARGLHDVMADASAWFTDQLNGLTGAEARAVLHDRGISQETARAFGIGFAPDSRGKLKTALGEYCEAMLVESGMLIEVDGKDAYDRFRGRLMIPIRDARGRTIAFGGRILDQGEPKYLNSPDTPLFDKGRTLYNLDKAAPAARKANRVLVVEGYMDVIALAQAGITEAVAPLGTALTETQLERLWRINDVPILCFDGDAAGQKAALRAAHRALPMLGPGKSLAFATLPQGQDPDDVVKAGGRMAMEALLKTCEPLVNRLWSSELSAGPLDTPEQRAGLKHRLSELAGSITDKVVGYEYRTEFRRRQDAQFAPPARRASGSFNTRDRARQSSAPVSEDAKRVHAAGIDRVLAKAVLAGLIRHPAEIARHMDVLGSLKLVDGALGRLFDAVIDLALEDSALDSGHLLTILHTSGFDTVASELLRADGMPYSFTRSISDQDGMRADLDEAIAILIAGPEVDLMLAEATQWVQASFTDAAFERQIALVKEKQALELRLANLVQANEDARAFGLEGN